MIVKQIDLHKAMELAGKGSEVLVLVPSGPETNWRGYMPDTLQEMLEGCLFFRKEPAMENSAFEDSVEETLKPESDSPPPARKQAPAEIPAWRMGPQWTVVPNGPR
ncbi:hypothetical protein AALB39_27805 [Lachnospiraceae bacterium 54-53]